MPAWIGERAGAGTILVGDRSLRLIPTTPPITNVDTSLSWTNRSTAHHNARLALVSLVFGIGVANLDPMRSTPDSPSPGRVATQGTGFGPPMDP